MDMIFLCCVSLRDRNCTPFARSLRRSGWRTTKHQKSVCLFIKGCNILRNGKSNHFFCRNYRWHTALTLPLTLSHSRSLDWRMRQTTACIRRFSASLAPIINSIRTKQTKKKSYLISSIRDNNNNNNSANVNEKVVLCVLLHWLLQENAISNGG